MLTAHGALPPESEAPRTTLAGVGRGTTIFINSNTFRNSTIDLRVQRLNALCGINGGRAELIAFLIWGETQHG